MDAALSWLRGEAEAPTKAVRDVTGCARDALKRLEARGLLALERREVLRDPFTNMRLVPNPRPELTDEQRAAVEDLVQRLGSYSGVLLQGVTGSGKTEVYLRVIDQVLERGQSALVLVPEIALTPQLVGRFRGRLGDQVAVLHSGLDPAARQEQWTRIARGDLPVVIGARSALFAPLDGIGVIVVDEEHDGSFKQETAPRYHARDLALVRGHLAGCPVILGSATPSLASWANVERGKLDRISLHQRVFDRPMPQVSLVDMRTAASVDPDRMFSTQLVDAMKANLEADEQTILFLNRRGFASFVLCRACGETMSCPSCSVSFTWHRRRARLVCHWCDHVEHLPPRCPKCQDDALQEIGFGTERVQAVLRELLPDARIERMDRDTTRGHALTRLLDAFRAREIDILVGTQMVAKGHDFPGVTLVGVLLAEMGLKIPDFRASERTFQLLTQIAGRAGRAERPGRVLVQTFMPQTPTLEHAVAHDAEGFLVDEMALRRDLAFPPWSSLALLRVSGPDAGRTEREARRVASALQRGATTAELRVQGPSPAPIERIKGRWRYQILVRSPGRRELGHTLAVVMPEIDAMDRPRAIQVILDVDPQSFL